MNKTVIEFVDDIDTYKISENYFDMMALMSTLSAVLDNNINIVLVADKKYYIIDKGKNLGLLMDEKLPLSEAPEIIDDLILAKKMEMSK